MHTLSQKNIILINGTQNPNSNYSKSSNLSLQSEDASSPFQSC